MTQRRRAEAQDWCLFYTWAEHYGYIGLHELRGRVGSYTLEVVERAQAENTFPRDEAHLKSVKREYVACLGTSGGCAEEWGEPRATVEEAKLDVVALAQHYLSSGLDFVNNLGTPRESGESVRESGHSYWQPIPKETRARVCWRTRDGSYEGQGNYQLIEDARAEIATEEDNGSQYVYWLEDEVGLPIT